MTCIVGYKENGKVYLGGDGAATQEHAVSQYVVPKVFKNGDYIFGFTESFRMGQILQYVFEPPVPKKNEKDLHKFMVCTFIPAVRLVLLEEGFAQVEDNVETGGTFLVGYKDRLFEIMDDYQVAEFVEDYTSIGCGDDFAMGAMFAMKNIKLSAENRIKRALEAASAHSGWVTPPYHIIST